MDVDIPGQYFMKDGLAWWVPDAVVKHMTTASYKPVYRDNDTTNYVQFEPPVDPGLNRAQRRKLKRRKK